MWRVCKEDNWEKFVVYNDVSSRTITSKSGANAAFVEFPSQFGATTSFSNLPVNIIETGTTPTKSTFHVFLIEILTFLSCAECFLCRSFREKELNERVIVASSTISSLGHVNLISLHNHIWRDWSVILSHPQHTPRPHTAFSLPWSVNQIKALPFHWASDPLLNILMRMFWSFACYSVMSFRLISSNLCHIFHISKVWKKI